TKTLHGIVFCIGISPFPKHGPYVPSHQWIEHDRRRCRQHPKYWIQHLIFLDSSLYTAGDETVPLCRLPMTGSGGNHALIENSLFVILRRLDLGTSVATRNLLDDSGRCVVVGKPYR